MYEKNKTASNAFSSIRISETGMTNISVGLDFAQAGIRKMSAFRNVDLILEKAFFLRILFRFLFRL